MAKLAVRALHLAATMLAMGAGLRCSPPSSPPGRSTSEGPSRGVSIAESRAVHPRASAEPMSRRAQLENTCFAEPWSPTHARYALKPRSEPQEERLRGLLSHDSTGCRDVHPNMSPRFAVAYPIPLAECHYVIAHIYYEEGRWSDAARWFRRVAFDDDSTEMALFAADLYYRSLRILGGAGATPRPSCYELFAEDGETLACRYCAPPRGLDQCAALQRMRFDIGQLLAGRELQSGTSSITCPSAEVEVAGRCIALPPMAPVDCTSRAPIPGASDRRDGAPSQ